MTTTEKIAAAGGRVTTVQAFLGLTDAEIEAVDRRVAKELGEQPGKRPSGSRVPASG